MHIKSISSMIEYKAKCSMKDWTVFHKKSDSIWFKKSDSMKDNNGDLEESLTVNQDLVQEKLNTLKSQLRVVHNKMIEKKAESKE